MVNNNRVVTALTVCVNGDLSCEVCPYYAKDKASACGTMKMEALDLIREQKVEIDRLREYEKIWHALSDRVQVISPNDMRIAIARAEEEKIDEQHS